jgi:hypothetical protein
MGKSAQPERVMRRGCADMTRIYEVAEERNNEMKRIVTALAVCLLVGGVASAQESFSWQTSPSSTEWHDPNNWSGPANEFPGQDDTDDVVTISAGSQQPEFSTNSGTRTVDTIDIDADTNGVTVSLTVSGGSLTTTGLVTVKGKQAVSDHSATLTVSSADAFKPNSITFDGRDHTTASHAIGVFNACMTVQGAEDNTTDTFVSGYVDWTIGSGVQINMKDLELDSNGADLLIAGTSSTLCTYSYTGNSQPISLSGVTWTNGTSCTSCP